MATKDNLTELKNLHSQLKINDNGFEATLEIGQFELNINGDKHPKEWSIYSPGTHRDFEMNSKGVPEAVRTDIQDIVEEWLDIKKIAEGKTVEKDPLDNLRDADFNLGDVVTEEPIIEPPKEEPVKNGMKPGGYNKLKEEAKQEIPYADYEEVEPPRKVSANSRRVIRCIKGLTPRLAEKGKIKIGKKGKWTVSAKGTKFRPPEAFDHFVVTTMEKNEEDDFKEDPVIMDILRKRAGSENEYKCLSLPVRLPYDDPTLNFNTSYSLYEGKICKCRGDGEYANIIATGEEIVCNPDQCKNYIKNKCKPTGILSAILDDSPSVGGVYKYRTVGWNSINNLFSSMEFIRGLTNGFLAGLPLMLTLTPKHTTIPGTSIPTVIHMVNLEYRGSLADMAKAIKQTIETRALMQYSVKDFEKLAEEALALPEAPEECKDIVDEFYPESAEAI